MRARVVLPVPGGPTSSRWSLSLPLAVITRSTCFACSWPTNSSRVDGRRLGFSVGLSGDISLAAMIIAATIMRKIISSFILPDCLEYLALGNRDKLFLEGSDVYCKER